MYCVHVSVYAGVHVGVPVTVHVGVKFDCTRLTVQG